LRKRLNQRLGLVSGADGSVAVYSSFDTVGDIAIIKLPPDSKADAVEVAQAVMDVNTGVKTVLLQDSKVTGPYRLRTLTWLAGQQKTQTIHKEHGCTFAVNLDTSYFSPRLSGERLRISKLVKPTETVINMFAGVGCFSVLIAKRVPSAKVFSIDINPDAFKDMEHNIHANRVFGQVVPLLGDAKTLIETRLQGVAERVLMPLPEKAIEYLPCAVSALKPEGGWVYCHCFEHASKEEDPQEKARAEISTTLCSVGVDFELAFSRIIRPVGPNWYHIVVDVHVC
jgi:tRNA (guanine37-N1)-methyltransferase